MNVKGKRVFVGLSGGVDSAVSTALLQRAGAEVTGVFIKGWYPPSMPCTWALDRRDAMRVAARLHIPFITLDASVEYKKSVIDYLLTEYKAGRTPNPDVMCNREIKFGVFYRFAKARGADYIATGHYRAGEKDQSYFLWAVPKEVLEKTIFPVGNMNKKEVRALAARCNLPVAEKKDSQGICFLGTVSVEDFLKKELGTNNPAVLYTIGQRVGSGGLSSEAVAKDGPWYVTAKDVDKKEIMVSHARAGSISEIRFKDANWLATPVSPLEAQYRYRGLRTVGRIEGGNTFIPDIAIKEPVSAGQSVVFYHGRDLIGGGIIDS